MKRKRARRRSKPGLFITLNKTSDFLIGIDASLCQRVIQQIYSWIDCNSMFVGGQKQRFLTF